MIRWVPLIELRRQASKKLVGSLKPAKHIVLALQLIATCLPLRRARNILLAPRAGRKGQDPHLTYRLPDPPRILGRHSARDFKPKDETERGGRLPPLFSIDRARGAAPHQPFVSRQQQPMDDPYPSAVRQPLATAASPQLPPDDDGGNGNREDLANWVNAGFVVRK